MGQADSAGGGAGSTRPADAGGGSSATGVTTPAGSPDTGDVPESAAPGRRAGTAVGAPHAAPGPGPAGTGGAHGRAEGGEPARPGDAGRAPRPGAAPRRACALAGWLPLLLVSVVVAFRVGGRDGVTPLPQLAAFLPWLLVPAAVGLLLMAAARNRAGCVWALVVLAATAWFVRPYQSAADPPSSPPRAGFRLLTANLRFGDATPALRAALRTHEPDIALVQECDTRCVAALRAPALRAAYPYRVIDSGDPAEGSAILSRYPLTAEPGVRGTLSMPAATARVAGVRLRLQVVHPMPPTPGSTDAWRTELGRLRDAAAARGDGAAVFGGDFNASQDHEAFRDILDTGLRDSAMLLGRSRTPTWPASTAPLFGTQIDHVLVGDRLSPADIDFPELAGTDHRAVLVDLQLR